MKHSLKKSLLKLLAFNLIFLIACGGGSSNNDPIIEDPIVIAPPPTQSSTLNILTIGDSRVQGSPPSHESYRYELWKNLVTNEWDFDLIGPYVDTYTYPSFMDKTFDSDHGGVSGAMTQNVLDNLATALADIDTPDIVLLGVGGNDLLFAMLPPETVVNNINQIVDELQTANSDVIIFVEQIAPARSDLMTTEFIATLNAFNSEIANLASSQTNNSSKVIAVDMLTDWQDSYMADQIHYSAEGAKAVADRYYIAIDENVTQ